MQKYAANLDQRKGADHASCFMQLPTAVQGLSLRECCVAERTANIDQSEVIDVPALPKADLPSHSATHLQLAYAPQ
jgi:hypothetical protein